ncbi:NAD(P)/FAD-dependent oxidoreductase [Mesorhizobium sp. M00.F.Ca.ET.216.01.1.1]|uniref:flavin-containing monooxygenase n=1 Tax=Mesorhizobium sp. M00.F.Ca.ET.216.01.1.1 TaxID=2500528 RepID=UPI000FD9F1D4|nr:NAD(P)/FAD-dependent oxidoreductase [Mesorhizobium sp. M00.F.Ca.ET.216.01.1.1]TGQ29053.1 pyridine nucleotide-disulfide oxidoreductase [Mesorhizobium sp. M00.F.Ca.ET.216.01.1.1]
MEQADVVIVGAGQAGIALSHCLRKRGTSHIVLERGRIGERWRSSTWRSLRLLTPNWLNALPGSPYCGPEPDGYMSRDAFVETLVGYAHRSQAPVHPYVDVLSCEQDGKGFRLRTTAGDWSARVVVVATGHCDVPSMPLLPQTGADQPASIHASQYRSPDELAAGGVLVVGASSSGVQIADELRRSGRRVILSVGKHTRLPRIWRDKDIFWWLYQMGFMSQQLDDLANPDSARRQPSLQLAGRADCSNVDLATLQGIGVELTGRLTRISNRAIGFADDLEESITAADAKQQRLLRQIDQFAGHRSTGHGPAPVKVPTTCRKRLSFANGIVDTIIWATGYSRSFSWLKLPAFTADGELAHKDGITTVAGLYALGFRFLRKRDSNFIGGVGADAQAIAAHVSDYLGQSGLKAA